MRMTVPALIFTGLVFAWTVSPVPHASCENADARLESALTRFEEEWDSLERLPAVRHLRESGRPGAGSIPVGDTDLDLLGLPRINGACFVAPDQPAGRRVLCTC